MLISHRNSSSISSNIIRKQAFDISNPLPFYIRERLKQWARGPLVSLWKDKKKRKNSLRVISNGKERERENIQGNPTILSLSRNKAAEKQSAGQCIANDYTPAYSPIERGEGGGKGLFYFNAARE